MGLAVGGLVLLLYLGTLSRHYSADSVLYALKMEGGQLEAILDPSHLLIEPLAYSWYSAWRAAGWVDGALAPLQVINAMAGAGSVVLLYGIVRRLTGSRRVAGLIAAGFAVSGGLWLLSVEAEFVTVPLVTMLLVLWLVLTPPAGLAERRVIYAASLGAAVALAGLTYLSSALLLVVAAAGVMLQDGRSRSSRLGQLAVVLAMVGLVCIPFAATLLGQRSWAEWTVRMWQDGGRGYTALGWLDGPHGVYTFLRSLGLFPGQALNDSGRLFLQEASSIWRWSFATYYGILLLMALAPVYLAVRHRKVLWARYRRPLVVVLLWSVLFSGFAVYWVPGDISFWLPLLVAWWLLVAMVTAGRIEAMVKEDGTPILARRALGSGSVVLAALVLLLALVNFATVMGPRHDLATNGAFQVAEEVRQRTGAEDIIVSGADEIVTLYVAYFAGRTVLPVDDLEGRPDEISRRYDEPLAEVRASGGQAYVLRGEQLVFLAP